MPIPINQLPILNGDGYGKEVGANRSRPELVLVFLFGVLCGQAGLRAQEDPPEPVVFRSSNPVFAGNLGQSIAAFGTDRVLVGEWANSAGGAYLFHADGTLLKKFPPLGGRFGWSVAAASGDRVLIGAPNDPRGSAYILNPDGNLLATLNPNAGEGRYFGWSLAEVGEGLIIVGEIASKVAGKEVAGSARLFRSDGTPVHTFTSPNPEEFANFGWAVAALGVDRVIISSRRAAREAGAVHIFGIGGDHRITIQNPQPAVAMKFGSSVAAMGTDRILVGASDDLAANQGGAAYLFTADGTLLTTFSNPQAPNASNFGASIAALGLDRVLIGAPEEKGQERPGLAYIFHAEGTLLTTLRKPDQRPLDLFGWAVAVLGPDRVLVTSIGDDTGASGAGVAYSFSVPAPPLSFPALHIARDADFVAVSWAMGDNLTLQQSDLLGSPPVWVDPTDPITFDGTTHTLRRSAIALPQSLFYRLHRP